MEKLCHETENILNERFGRDTVIALATTNNGLPYVRFVNAYYENRAFYIITHKLSNKMKQLERNPVAAVSGEWFSAQGRGFDLGSFCNAENRTLAEKLRVIFAAWINNGHNDLGETNTRILCVKLSDGVLFSHGTRYEIDFT